MALIAPKNKYGINAMLVRGYAEINSLGGRFTENPAAPYQPFHKGVARVSWTMREIAKMGFGWVRDWFSLPTIESTIANGGTWDSTITNPAKNNPVNKTTTYSTAGIPESDWAAMDELIACARKYGIVLSITMPFLNAAGWGEGEYDNGNATNWRTKLHDPVVDAFLARYANAHDVLVLDAYNEAFGSIVGSNLADLAIDFYDRVKAASPNMTVALPGQVGSASVIGLLDWLNARSRLDAFDWVAVHVYPYPDWDGEGGTMAAMLEGDISAIKTKLGTYSRGSAPIMLQEYGYGGSDADADEADAINAVMPVVNGDSQIKCGCWWQAWKLNDLTLMQDGAIVGQTNGDPWFYEEGGIGFPWPIGMQTGLWFADSSPIGQETATLPGTFRGLIPAADRWQFHSLSGGSIAGGTIR